MLVKYATLWLFTLALSPCNLYVLFTSHFRLIYSRLNRRHSIFFTAFTMLCSTHVCVYACSLCMYVKYLVYICVHITPRHIPHFVGDGEVN